MRNRTPIEMTTALYHLNLSAHLFNRRDTAHQLPNTALVLAVKPFSVVAAYVHWTPKCICPFEVRCVEVRVANYNRFEPAF